MPEDATYKKANYPENGWSNYWGDYLDVPYPSAAPYGIVIRAPGSTGGFRPLNSVHGVKFPISEPILKNHPIYISTLLFPVGDLSARMFMHFDLAVGLRINILWYFEGGLPPFLYVQDRVETWTNMRKTLTIAGPGPPPIPLFSKVGDVVTLEPWNKKGWELLE